MTPTGKFTSIKLEQDLSIALCFSEISGQIFLVSFTNEQTSNTVISGDRKSALFATHICENTCMSHAFVLGKFG